MTVARRVERNYRSPERVVVDDNAMADVSDLLRRESAGRRKRDYGVVARGILVLYFAGGSPRPAAGEACTGPVRGGASRWDVSGRHEAVEAQARPGPRHRFVTVRELLQPSDRNGCLRRDFLSLQPN